MTANLLYAALSGLAGALAMLIPMYIFVGSGLSIDIPYLIGSHYTNPDQQGKVYSLGVILFLLIGGIWGVLYIIFMMAMVEAPQWTLGLLFGAAHGFFAGVLLSTYADNHPYVGEDKLIPDPGMFGNRWGTSIPFLIIFLHIIFGFVTVIVYNHFYHPEYFPHMN